MVLWSETEPVNFNSAEFLVFYAIVFVGYFCLPHRFRWMLLLVASYWFYAQWNVAYLTLIVYASGCAYSAGLLLSRRDGRFGKLILWIAIVLLLLPLLVFKYASFFVTSVVALLSYIRLTIDIPPPQPPPPRRYFLLYVSGNIVRHRRPQKPPSCGASPWFSGIVYCLLSPTGGRPY